MLPGLSSASTTGRVRGSASNSLELLVAAEDEGFFGSQNHGASPLPEHTSPLIRRETSSTKQVPVLPGQPPFQGGEEGGGHTAMAPRAALGSQRRWLGHRSCCPGFGGAVKVSLPAPALNGGRRRQRGLPGRPI
ncbi:hypothetical protein PAHAL_9G068100 [Panicum hallii]|uniref:Uncharacterized protein n=1 Tax=Panicum hallii TaxID=206008 RepID=A0A2T8I0F0_9POAL|nr:hypothetical protein PAHAL_9G068100 [Panicum hallii]